MDCKSVTSLKNFTKIINYMRSKNRTWATRGSLARKCGVNWNTLKAALNILEDLGHVEHKMIGIYPQWKWIDTDDGKERVFNDGTKSYKSLDVNTNIYM